MNPKVRKIGNKLIVWAKNFAHSGTKNILRGVFTVIGWVSAMLLTTAVNCGDTGFLTVLRCMFLDFKIWIPFLVAGVVFGILTIMIKMNPENMLERYKRENKDENGVQMATNGTYGTAGWMPKKEAHEKLEVDDIQHCNGVILGGYDTEGREVVCIPRGTKVAREITNQNVCIFGSPGEGKSWGYARCNMLQAIRRGESVIVTDPKGELYTDTAKLFRNNGYTVKVFNLANPKKSDAWNCMDVCYNKETGNVDLNRVKIFVEAIMKNTSDPSDKNDYFANNERTLYEAVIMYMAEKYCKEYRSKLDLIVERTATGDNHQIFYDYSIKYARSDSSIKEVVAAAKAIFIEYGPTQSLISQVIREANGHSVETLGARTAEERAAQFDEFLEILTAEITKPTLSNVYYKINSLKDLEAFKAEVDALDCPTALCHIPLNIILMQSPSVWPNFTNGCNVRLNVLNDEMLRLMVSEDDIDLSAPGREKCAYFCIFPDQDFTFQFVSSLFFTFLFKDQIETADNNGGNPVAINYILDEFANIGMIPDFSNKISTARSRNIGITIILQTITQLYQVYTPNVSNTILGCCATQICLGANDDMTIKYFVNLLGETTIIARSTKDDRQVGHIDNLFPEYSENLGEGKRNLLTFDEMRRIKATDLIVVCAHMKPLLLKKLTAAIHPLSNKGRFEKTSISDIRPFVERYPGCEQRDCFAQAEYVQLRNKIKELERRRNDANAVAAGRQEKPSDTTSRGRIEPVQTRRPAGEITTADQRFNAPAQDFPLSMPTSEILEKESPTEVLTFEIADHGAQKTTETITFSLAEEEQDRDVRLVEDTMPECAPSERSSTGTEAGKKPALAEATGTSYVEEPGESSFVDDDGSYEGTYDEPYEETYADGYPDDEPFGGLPFDSRDEGEGVCPIGGSELSLPDNISVDPDTGEVLEKKPALKKDSELEPNQQGEEQGNKTPNLTKQEVPPLTKPASVMDVLVGTQEKVQGPKEQKQPVAGKAKSPRPGLSTVGKSSTTMLKPGKASYGNSSNTRTVHGRKTADGEHN